MPSIPFPASGDLLNVMPPKVNIVKDLHDLDGFLHFMGIQNGASQTDQSGSGFNLGEVQGVSALVQSYLAIELQ